MNLATRAARRKLVPSKTVYWTSIGNGRSGLKLGYRKSERSGVWVAKLVHDGARIETTLGSADDGEGLTGAINFSDAVGKAIEWSREVREQLKASRDAAPEAAMLTVGDITKGYIGERVARSPKAGMDAKCRLTRHVLRDEKFAKTPLAGVTAHGLARWREGLAEMAPPTENRLCNDVRAALNAAVERHWRDLPQTISREIKVGLRPLRNAETARHALLTDADIMRAVEAAYQVDADLGALVLTLAATGARFSQVAQLTVGDVQAAAGRLMVPTSAKGKGSRARSDIAVRVGADVVERLKPLLAGRSGHEPLLMRWVHEQVKGRPMEWVRVRRAPWGAAAFMQRGWQEALEQAGVAKVEPYALRHSSIVRMLREGLPTRLVASLHDTSVAMIEKHYAAYIVDALDELASRAIVPLAPTQPAAIRAVK
jgi:integrase